MPVFTNTSDVIEHTMESDIRFMPIALPHGFNHWHEARRQLLEDNLAFFTTGDQAESMLAALNDPELSQIGVLATEHGQRGFMIITGNSRYICTDWVARLHQKTHVPQPYVGGLLGVAIRKVLYAGAQA